MNVGIVIFARMNSTRLPGKALMPIGARPLVGHVLDRSRRVLQASGVVLATSSHPSDAPLVSFAQAEGVPVYRGSLENVTERAFQCAREHGFTHFARVCGDRPFFDPGDIDRAVASVAEQSGPIDLVSSNLRGAAPPGLTTELVRTAALEQVLTETSDPQDLEHVTRYLYTHPEQFRMIGITIRREGVENLRFVVDTMEDLARTRYVVSRLGNPAAASVAEVSELTRAWTEGRAEERYA